MIDSSKVSFLAAILGDLTYKSSQIFTLCQFLMVDPVEIAFITIFYGIHVPIDLAPLFDN